MVEKLNTHVVTTFEGDDSDNPIPMKWEVHPQGCPSAGYSFFSRCFRLYPVRAMAGVQAASFGKVEFAGETEWEQHTEYIKFNNSDSAQGSYPIVGGVSVNLQFAFDANGKRLGDIDFQFVGKEYKIKASKPFTGAALITYWTNYAIFKYEPEVAVPKGAGYFAQYGNIINFYRNDMADIVVQPPRWEEDAIRLELYRVTSNILLNKFGNWETPYEWDTFNDGQKAWPQHTESPVKGGNGAENARIHEIGYFYSGTSTVTYDRAFVPLEAPKTGSSWKPKYKFEWTQSLEAAGDDYELLSTLNRINYDSIIDRIKSTYSGIEGVVDFFKGR